MQSLFSTLVAEKPHVSSAAPESFDSPLTVGIRLHPLLRIQSSITDWVEILSSEKYKENDYDGCGRPLLVQGAPFIS